MSDEKAEKLMEEGEKKLSKFAIFTSGEEKRDNARERFIQAATLFKASGNWAKSAAAYQRAADMALANKCNVDFVSDSEHAAMMYRKGGDGRAKALLTRVVDMYDQAGKYAQAAKFCVTIGETEGLDDDEALSWLGRGAKYYANEGSHATACELVLKTADIYVRAGQYERARSTYDQVARQCLDDRLSQCMTRKYFFNALLCQLASATKERMDECVEVLSERFDEYQSLDPQFSEHTREHMLIRGVIAALQDGDIRAYDEAVDDFDQVVPLTEARRKMLLRGKQLLRSLC